MNLPELMAYLTTPVDEIKSEFRMKAQNAPITCLDGTELSVQTGDTLYCTPRDNYGPWSHVEVGFPTVTPPVSWRDCCEDWENPTETVYGYVPIQKVVDFINVHGGIRIGANIRKEDIE